MVKQQEQEYNHKTVDNRTWKGHLIYVIAETFIHSQFVPFFILFFYAIYTLNFYILFVQALIYAYQLSPYCTKQQWFLDFIRVNDQYKYFKDWTCTFEEPLEKTRCLIAATPHGMLNWSFIMNSGEYYKGVHILGSRVMLGIPMNGLYLRWCGCQPVDAINMKKLMKKGDNMAILPGGFEEATITSTTKCRMFIKKRKGFIKYALQHGYKVYPMFAFGENKLYTCFEPFMKLRLKLNKFKLPGVMFFSKFGLLPSNNVNLNSVIGKPLELPQISEPSQEEIDKYHEQFIEAMKTLFYKNREKYGETSDLHIY